MREGWKNTERVIQKNIQANQIPKENTHLHSRLHSITGIREGFCCCIFCLFACLFFPGRASVYSSGLPCISLHRLASNSHRDLLDSTSRVLGSKAEPLRSTHEALMYSLVQNPDTILYIYSMLLTMPAFFFRKLYSLPERRSSKLSVPCSPWGTSQEPSSAAVGSQRQGAHQSTKSFSSSCIAGPNNIILWVSISSSAKWYGLHVKSSGECLTHGKYSRNVASVFFIVLSL